MPMGEVVAIVSLENIYSTRDAVGFARKWDEEEFGDYGPGRWAWMFKDIKRIIPVPAKGAMGLWDWQGEIVPWEKQGG